MAAGLRTFLTIWEWNPKIAATWKKCTPPPPHPPRPANLSLTIGTISLNSTNLHPCTTLTYCPHMAGRHLVPWDHDSRDDWWRATLFQWATITSHEKIERPWSTNHTERWSGEWMSNDWILGFFFVLCRHSEKNLDTIQCTLGVFIALSSNMQLRLKSTVAILSILSMFFVAVCSHTYADSQWTFENKTKQNVSKFTNHNWQTRPNPVRETNCCFLGGELRWLTAKKNFSVTIDLSRGHVILLKSAIELFTLLIHLLIYAAYLFFSCHHG